ncbi:hypothetical protein ACLQ28_22450 [Micromonospora sp. DT201]|uniref:hypothetical protein n=1 Tax=Micromonospora sp. DT201 TaxID=3393442 RepID=UPI003CEB052F
MLLVVGAVYIAAVAGLGSCSLWIPRRRASGGTLGTCPVCGDHQSVSFTYSTWPYFWLVATLLMSALIGAFVAIAVATTGVPGLAVGIGLMLLTLGLVWFLVVLLRLAPGRVSLCRTGLYHRSLNFTHVLPWFSVYEVSAEWIGSPLIVAKAYPADGAHVRRYTGRFGTQEMQFLPFMTVRARWLAADATAVFYALRFYLENPELRTELGTTAALSRIHSGSLNS